MQNSGEILSRIMSQSNMFALVYYPHDHSYDILSLPKEFSAMPLTGLNFPNDVLPFFHLSYDDELALRDAVRRIDGGSPEEELTIAANVGSSIMWMNFHLMNFLDADGNTKYAIGYGFNITSEKKRDNLIMNTIVHESCDFIASIDPKTGLASFSYLSAKIRAMVPKWNIDVLLPYEEEITSVIDSFFTGDMRDELLRTASLPYIISHLEKEPIFATSYDIMEKDTLAHKQLQYCWLDNTRRELLVLQNDVTSTVEEENSRTRKEEESRKVLNYIALEVYDFISILDLNDGCMELVSGSYFTNGAPTPPSMKRIAADKLARSISEMYLEGQEAERFIRELNLREIEKQLGEKPKLVFVYDVTKNGAPIARKIIRVKWLNEEKRQALVTKADITESYMKDQQLKIYQIFQEGISRMFDSAFILNLDKNEYVTVQISDTMAKYIPPRGKKTDLIEIFVSAIKGQSNNQMSEELAEKVRELELKLSTDWMREHVRGNDIVEIDYHRPRDGKEKWFRESLFAVGTNEAGITNRVIVFTTETTVAMTERNRLKQALIDAANAAEQASKAKTAFLANMSHDIRTPMNAIVGFTGIATAHIGDKAKVEDCLSKILLASNHLQRLINNVLEMSRIESGKESLDERKCCLLELVQSIVAVVEPQIAKKHQIFSVECGDLRDEHVYADELKLNQVLINLIGNAVKYTPAGGKVTFRIEEHPTSREQHAGYRFIISDTGIGMSEDFLAHIGRPFEREANTTISGIEGTGLGLTITKSIIEMMGGTLTIKSALGKGSTFIASIELKKCEDDHESHSDEPLAVAEPETQDHQADHTECLKTRHLLVVEDNELNQEIAVEVLKSAGFEVELASDGSEAVELLKNTEPGQIDVVLMDVQMPIMDGYEATRQIRKSTRPDLAAIPIIAMTANAFEEDRQMAFSSGMNDHVAKPLDVKLLLATIKKFLR